MSSISLKTKIDTSESVSPLVYSYPSLMGNRRIDILRGERLYGTIDGKNSLELRGIPPDLLAVDGKGRLESYLRQCYPVVCKGVDGEDSAISLRPALLGGTRTRIPFQPGLALGSIVKGDVVKKLVAYADKTRQVEQYQMQIEEAEQRYNILEAKIRSYKEQGRANTSSGRALISVWEKEMEGITEKMIPNLEKALCAISYDSDFFVNFQAGLHSPIDTEKSHIEIQPRAFDSLSYSSQYIKMGEDISKIHDKISQSSSSGSASASVGCWMGKGQVSAASARAAADRVVQIKGQEIAEAVLVVNAFMTTRNVRTFTKIHYNYDTLKKIYEAMQKDDPSKWAEYGINANEGSKEILILTEAVMGASFTGIITFLNEGKTRGSEEHHFKESQHSASASVKRGFFGFGGSVGGSYSGQNASGSEDNVLANYSNTRVNIEIFCQGAIPTFAREVVERELLKHVDLNPAKFELSTRDEKTVEDLLSGDGQKMQRANLKQQVKMQNAAVGVLNACRGLKSVTEKDEIHTTHSVFTSYDNFSRQITEDKDCGVPVGFNYTVLSEKEIKELLDAREKELEKHSSAKGKEEEI